jgi:hypothetical protein
MPHFSPKLLIRADQIAQRYSVRPSTLLGVLDTHAAWCVDEACAIAGNLQEERNTAKDTTEKSDPNDPGYAYIGTERGMPVIRGNIPIIPPPQPKG